MKVSRLDFMDKQQQILMGTRHHPYLLRGNDRNNHEFPDLEMSIDQRTGSISIDRPGESKVIINGIVCTLETPNIPAREPAAPAPTPERAKAAATGNKKLRAKPTDTGDDLDVSKLLIGDQAKADAKKKRGRPKKAIAPVIPELDDEASEGDVEDDD